jgi:hypothetical protein
MLTWFLSCVFISLIDFLHKCSYGNYLSLFEYLTLICLFGVFLNTNNRK